MSSDSEDQENWPSLAASRAGLPLGNLPGPHGLCRQGRPLGSVDAVTEGTPAVPGP